MPWHVSDGEKLYYAKEENDYLTKLLCEATSKIVNKNELSEDLKNWINGHKLNDILRIKTQISYLQDKLKDLENNSISCNERVNF